MQRDVIYALRMFRRSPGFAGAAIVTLALGVGANTAIFSMVDAAVLRPLPYEAPERLVTFTLHNPASGRKTTGAMPREFLDWRARNAVFDQVALVAGGLHTLLGAGEPEEIRVARVSAGYFEMLCARPTLGRSFTEADEFSDRPRVLIISHGFWKARFGSASDVIGQRLHLDDQPYEIVGVLPARFEYPVGATQQTGIFLPLIFAASDRQRGSVQSRGYNPTGRLRDGVTVAQAEAAMGVLQAELDRDHVGFNKGFTRVEIQPLLDDYVGDARSWMRMLLGAVALVLLIACANVANLVLAHATGRVRELTIRSALGASRWRLARQLLSETLLLSAIGGLGGLAVAWWGLSILRVALPTSVPRAAHIGLDARVLGFTMLCALATGIVCGVLPALLTSRSDVAAGLKQGGTAATAGKGGRRIRYTLAWAEVALAAMLLVGAGLFISSFGRLLHVDQGFDALGVVSFRISGPRGSDDPARNRASVLEALAAVRALPGIEAAVTESGGPFTGGYSTYPVRPGRGEPGQELEVIRFRKVSAGFLELLRVPLLRGRGFTSHDTASSVPVALINEIAARRFWGEVDPIGQPLKIEDTTFAIVGIVGNMRYGGPAAAPAPEAFLPFEQTARNGGTIIFRGPATSGPAVKAAIWNLNPAQPITDMRTAEEQFARATATRRFNMLLMITFAALALTIAATGIYGVIALLVGQRTREVGVRVALGARPSQVVRLFLTQGAAVLVAGIASGTLGAWGLSSTIQSFLFEVHPRDPLVFALAGGLLAVVGLVACWIPARRATRTDPLVALRTE